MNYPLGSILILVFLVFVISDIVTLPRQYFKLVICGLAGILLGSFLIVPLPAPAGLQLSLNIGHFLIPLVLLLFVWGDAEVEDKYHASMGSLAVGLTLYGITSLLELEPGLIGYPLLCTIPITVLIAVVCCRNTLAAVLAVAGGCSLVSVLSVLELILTQDRVASLELPDYLVWNTLSIGSLASAATIKLNILAERRYKSWVTLRSSKVISQEHPLSMPEQLHPVEGVRQDREFGEPE